MEKRYISIDIETTGLDPESCQILEIGAVIEDWESPILELPTFHCYVRHLEYRGEPYALALNSKILGILAKSESKLDPDLKIYGPAHIEFRFNEWLKRNNIHYLQDRITVAGKNFGSFDLQFLKRLLNFNQLASRFRHRYIDPAMLYWEPNIDGSTLPDLKKCLARAGMTDEVTHTAVEDAQLVIKLVRHYYDRKIKRSMR